MIECKNIGYSYTDYALNKKELFKDLSFSIAKDEKVLLLGVNGCGKSTLLKLLNALITPSSGQYLFEGEQVDKSYLKSHAKTFRKRVVLGMQDPSTMLFNPTVYDEIAFGLRHFGYESVDERVHHYASLFGVEKILKESPLKLSGGQKQKVLLASLLCLEPEVLLLDEPTAHLDPLTTGWLVEFLEELKVTSLIATHNLSLGRELATRAIVLGEGEGIIYDGGVDTLLDDTETLLKAKLLHRHKHTHNGVEHSHYHMHSWS